MLDFQSHRVARYRFLAGLSGCFALAVGLLVLIGWQFGIDSFKRVMPGMISMNPLTAVCHMLAGASLSLQTWWKRPVALRIAKLLALLVFLTGVVRFGAYLTDWDFPLDRILFADQLHHDEPMLVNRVSANTALGFLLVGLALLLLDCGNYRRMLPHEPLAMLAGALALFTLVGHFYRIDWRYGMAAEVPMALYTAVAMMVLAVGIAMARPDRGLMAVVTGNSAGGLLARRMFPAIMVALIVAGGLGLAGVRRGYYQGEFGVALFTVLSIMIFGVFLLWSAWSLHRSDIERRKVTDERERFFMLSLDLLGSAGEDGYFKRVNPSFGRVLGYDTGEILSRPFISLVHPDDVVRTMEVFARLKSGSAILHFVNRYRCKDGSWKWLEWSAGPFTEDGLVYAVARDITEQREADQAILALNAELLDKTARLESLNAELESFSYSVSHDLRAPLRGIFGFAEALEEHSGAALDETGRGYLQRVRNAANRMGQLIDDLLKLSRLTRAGMKMEVVNLSELAESVIAGLRQMEPARAVEVAITPDITVLGDAALLRIVLENLLGNAWKFTARNPRARIEMSSAATGTGKVACIIRDNGVGFDSRYAHKLFGAFQRLHPQAEFPGSGIGLATVQRIIHRHGGEVSGKSEIDLGAEFVFTLDMENRSLP